MWLNGRGAALDAVKNALFPRSILAPLSSTVKFAGAFVVTQFEVENALPVPKGTGRSVLCKTQRQNAVGFVEAARFQGGQLFAIIATQTDALPADWISSARSKLSDGVEQRNPKRREALSVRRRRGGSVRLKKRNDSEQ